MQTVNGRGPRNRQRKVRRLTRNHRRHNDKGLTRVKNRVMNRTNRNTKLRRIMCNGGSTGRGRGQRRGLKRQFGTLLRSRRRRRHYRTRGRDGPRRQLANPTSGLPGGAIRDDKLVLTSYVCNRMFNRPTAGRAMVQRSGREGGQHRVTGRNVFLVRYARDASNARPHLTASNGLNNRGNGTGNRHRRRVCRRRGATTVLNHRVKGPPSITGSRDKTYHHRRGTSFSKGNAAFFTRGNRASFCV